MIQEDTVKLLRECNAGIKMGVSSLDEVLPKVQSASLRNSLEKCRQAHGKLGDETHALLARYGDAGKEPSPVAKGMSWMKTNVKLALEESDETVADLITEGCNMGVKSLRGNRGNAFGQCFYIHSGSANNHRRFISGAGGGD